MKHKIDRPKIIGFDMDGVILDHTQNKLLLAKKLKLNIKKKETPTDIIKALIPSSDYPKYQFDLYDNPKFKYSCSLMNGTKQVLEKLIKNKTPYFLVSRRKKPIGATKILKHHGLWPKYFNKTNTFFVLTPKDKNTKSKELGITHYFDDQHTILNELVSVKNKFLFDNLDVFKNSPMRRVKSWKEISKLI